MAFRAFFRRLILKRRLDSASLGIVRYINETAVLYAGKLKAPPTSFQADNKLCQYTAGWLWGVFDASLTSAAGFPELMSEAADFATRILGGMIAASVSVPELSFMRGFSRDDLQAMRNEPEFERGRAEARDEIDRLKIVAPADYRPLAFSGHTDFKPWDRPGSFLPPS